MIYSGLDQIFQLCLILVTNLVIIIKNKSLCPQTHKMRRTRHTASQDNYDNTGMRRRESRMQISGCVKGRGGIYLVAGRTVARQPQQQLWLSQHPQDGPE